MVLKSPAESLTIALPATVDLMRLGNALESKGVSRKLARALRTAWRAQSCFADLGQAQGACDTLDTLTPAVIGDPGVLLHVQSSLLSTAILLYARATTTSSAKANERGSIQLDLAKLTAEQVEDHNTLVRVRNGALGHVENGAPIAGDYWHRDFLFAKRVGATNWEVASASTSIGFHLETFTVLKRQLPVSAGQLQSKCQERIAGAMDVIRELNLRDIDLLRYQVDPIQWFGSLPTALMALGVKSGEEASGWTPLL